MHINQMIHMKYQVLFDVLKKRLNLKGSSVVECLTRGRGAVGSSLTGITVVSLSKTHLSLLRTGSTQEEPSQHN